MGASSTPSAEATLDALSDPVIVVGPTGGVQLVNAAAAALLGEEAAALVERPAPRLFPERLRRVQGLDIVEWLRTHGEGRGVRAPFLRHDGVEITQVVQVSATSTEAVGTVTILVLRALGDTPGDLEIDALSADPVCVETAPPTVDGSYEVVFESVPVGVLHFDGRGRVTACNECLLEQLGSARELVLGIDLRTLNNPGVVHAVRDALDGREGRFEGEYVSATGGRRRLLRATFSPILDGERVRGGVAIVDDVTERRAIEERLAQGERMASLGRLAAGVAHEINNPLAYVRTSLEVARRLLRAGVLRAGDGDAARRKIEENLERALDGVERVRVIAGDLRTFSRGDEGSWLPVDMAKVVDTAVALASAEIRDVAPIERDVAEVPPVMGSETRFVQVLVNLLINAAQAIEAAGPRPGGAAHVIRVRVRGERGRVILDVEDTGEGIPPDLVPHVFEPFWTSKEPGKGTGLGLSICHGIVNAAGGDIEVLRSRAREGTVVRVTLPLSPTVEAPPPEAQRAAPELPRVLVIDDETRLARTLALGLGDRYEVDVVDNGAAALELLRAASPYRLILCDLTMPKLDGMQLYEILAEERPEVAERFVLMTGGAFTERAREFLRARPLRRLEKPFALEDVERLLREA